MAERGVAGDAPAEVNVNICDKAVIQPVRRLQRGHGLVIVRRAEEQARLNAVVLIVEDIRVIRQREDVRRGEEIEALPGKRLCVKKKLEETSPAQAGPGM